MAKEAEREQALNNEVVLRKASTLAIVVVLMVAAFSLKLSDIAMILSACESSSMYWLLLGGYLAFLLTAVLSLSYVMRVFALRYEPAHHIYSSCGDVFERLGYHQGVVQLAEKLQLSARRSLADNELSTHAVRTASALGVTALMLGLLVLIGFVPMRYASELSSTAPAAIRRGASPAVTRTVPRTTTPASKKTSPSTVNRSHPVSEGGPAANRSRS